jgi:drug/metabolite transporter (DMT)-like permease
MATPEPVLIDVRQRSATLRVAGLTAIAMTAFAANSVLCRLALKYTTIDAATFTSIRLLSGALMLTLLTLARGRSVTGEGNWLAAAALFAYAAAFSFAYVGMSAGTGALLLFTTVQMTMIAHAFWRGERLGVRQWLGFLTSLAGLVILLLPGLSAPPAQSAALMLSAGVAWGVYSIRGRGCADPAAATSANFLRSLPMTVVLSGIFFARFHFDAIGALYALVSGALASGVGYAIWYAALRDLRGTSAAAVQLSVPALAAVGGIAFLGEPVSWRLLFASAAILGGIGLVVIRRTQAQ